MILLRRPFLMFDVDLAGAGLLALLLVGALLGGLLPYYAEQRNQRTLETGLAQAQRRAQNTRSATDELLKQAQTLRAALDTRMSEAPAPTELNALLADVVGGARDAGLALQAVSPQPPERFEGYLRAPIDIQATGTPAQLVRFLAWLARRHPYHSPTNCTLGAPRDVFDGVCTISVTLVLNMLPPPADSSAAPAASGERS